MAETQLGAARLASIVGLSALTLGIGLGGSSRLTYHEAFVAQAAREMILRGALLVPTINGQPWLEKPPLTFWLVALTGKISGEVTEFTARLPSAIAATFLALGVAIFAVRRFGRNVGWLAGLIQATTFWFVVRGRLAEADILLACLITWTIVAFDRLRTHASASGTEDSVHSICQPDIAVSLHVSLEKNLQSTDSTSCVLLAHANDNDLRSQPFQKSYGYQLTGDDPYLSGTSLTSLKSIPSPCWSWTFFVGLGTTALVKGIGFGAVLISSVVITVLLWDRDRATIKTLMSPKGWILAAILALTWPSLVVLRLPAAVSLWTLHVTDRLASHPEHFIGGPWWQYGPAMLAQALPWTPLALLGAWSSLIRTRSGHGGVDRLLWAWTVVPVLVLSTATVKNAHYAIHALPPLAVWAALGLIRVANRLQRRRAWSLWQLQLNAFVLFIVLGLGHGLGYLWLGPRFDHQGTEWIWCAEISQALDPDTELVFLYEDWDRKPYPTPFGPVPHDWAVRLYYLNRQASWRRGVGELIAFPPVSSFIPYALLGRDRDLPALCQLGYVKTLLKGPCSRFDREFTLFQITPLN